MEILKQLVKLPGLKQIYRQGGIDSFTLAHKDIMETMRDDLDKQALELAKVKLAEMLSIVDEKQVVALDKRSGAIYIGGEAADAGQLLNLKSEALFIAESNLWRLLNETPKQLAQKAMFVSGESLADLNKGRSMLYTLSTQENILNMFKSYESR